MNFKIVESAAMVEQFRFPRSGKRRIRQKWENRNENFRPMMKAIQNGWKLICHPIFAARLRRINQFYPAQ